MSTVERFRATDNVEVTDHARENWYARFWGNLDGPPYPVEVAWRDARPHPVAWGRFNGVFVRMHPRTKALLVARRLHAPSGARTVVLTALPHDWHLDRPAVRRVLREVRRS